MGYAFTPQVLGLTMAPNHNKHRAGLGGILSEMMKDRKTKSSTFKPELMDNNLYYSSVGSDYAEPIINMFQDIQDNYKQVVIVKGEERYRKLRNDTVLGVATIFNPSVEIQREILKRCNYDLNAFDKQMNKFYEDCNKCMAQLCPDLYHDNIVATAYHKDEGRDLEDRTLHIAGCEIICPDYHVHQVRLAQNKNGKWCGNKIDFNFFQNINQNFPRLMRAYGWDFLDDLDITDWNNYDNDPEYRETIRTKRSLNGLPASTIRALKKVEKKNEEDLINNQINAQKNEEDALNNRIKAQELYMWEKDLNQMQKLLDWFENLSPDKKAEFENKYPNAAKQIKIKVGNNNNHNAVKQIMQTGHCTIDTSYDPLEEFE